MGSGPDGGVGLDPPNRVDWATMMRLGIGRLGLAPDTFWAMSPTEFRAALEGAGIVTEAALTLDRPALTELMAAFPDRADGGET